MAEFLSGGRSAKVGEWEELTGIRADGEPFPVEVSASRGDLPGGSFFAAYIRDISERKRAEEERLKLEQQVGQAQKMHAIGRLASGVAHDFNNLLAVIVGHTELLLGAHPNRNPDREALLEIRDTTERAAALTGQILAFSRNRSAELRMLDLNVAVSDLAPLLQRLIGQDVELTIRCDPDIGNIRAEPAKIDQVLVNLAANARDAMPQDGHLTITTAAIDLDDKYLQVQHPGLDLKAGAYVLLSVSDTGVGMDGDTQARIFEPFFTTKAAGEGTGLGLATVYGVAQQTDGFVSVHSRPGHGATFNVYFPVVEAAEPAIPPDRVPSGPLDSH